nr:hypothetical protein [Tanacetum cinerariifolium]
CLVALQTKQAEFEKYKAFNDRTIDYDKLKIQAVEATDDSPTVPEHITVETPMNMSPENKAHFKAEKETSHLILTEIGDEIYLTVDACQTAQEMWEAVERLQQVETDDSNVIPDSPDMCEDDIQNDQNDVESDDERIALANLKLDTKQAEFEKYKAFNDRTIDYGKLKSKLNETLGQLAQKDIEIKEVLKTKAYEISVVKEKHEELVKQSLLTKSHYEGLVKQKTKIKHSKDQFRATTAQDIEIRIQTCLMPHATKTQNDSFRFVHELKQEMHVDLKYVESLKKEINKLESDKAEFSDMYDVILKECVSKDVMCSYLQSLSDLDALAELQCLYLHKVKEYYCLAQKLLNQTKSVSKEVHNELLKRFAKVEKNLISLEIALQKRKEQTQSVPKTIVSEGMRCLTLVELDVLANESA